MTPARLLELLGPLLAPMLAAVEIEMRAGRDEQAALRAALAKLAEAELGAPVLPELERMIAGARAADSDEDAP